MSHAIIHRTDRRSIRHAAELECHVIAERGFRRIRGKMMDVSPSGLRVASDCSVDVGEHIVMSMKLPGGRTWVDAYGRVARIEHGTRAGDTGRTISIQFTVMDPVDRALLAGATATIPPPIPRRTIRKDYAATIHEIASLA